LNNDLISGRVAAVLKRRVGIERRATLVRRRTTANDVSDVFRVRRPVVDVVKTFFSSSLTPEANKLERLYLGSL
jgi:hypothetical protein